MALAVVQNLFGINTIQVPGSKTLGSTPTVGNLIVAFLGVNITASSLVIDTTKWTMFEAIGKWDETTWHMVAVYRYVQGGDTSALPAFCTSGTTYWTHAIYEISGVTGTWATDLLFSCGREDVDIGKALPTFPSVANGSLALTSVACYNGNANPSISGSWTLDNASNNSANFGNLGSASRVISTSGTALDGTWTPNQRGGGNPFAGIVAMFTPSAPPTAYPRHQYTIEPGTTSHPTTLTVPWTPVIGNLIVIYLLWGDGTVANPTIDPTNWTVFKTLVATTDYTIGIYRYVQSGDTATLPNICTAGSALYAPQVLEISGVTGTFGTDHISDKSGFQSNATPFTTTSDTTNAVNQFAVISYGEATSTGTQAVISSPWTNGTAQFNNSAWGTSVLFFQFYPSSGSTVQGTITPQVSTLPQGYIQSIFGAPSSVTLTPGAGSLTLTGLAPSIRANDLAFTPNAGGLTLNSSAAQMGSGLFPPAGSLTLNGVTPTVRSNDLAFTPFSGSLQFRSGGAPLIQYNMFPPSGSLTLTGNAPSTGGGLAFTPASGSLTLTGPAARIGFGLFPPSGTLTLTGGIPMLHPFALTPPSGALNIVGFAPTISYGKAIRKPFSDDVYAFSFWFSSVYEFIGYNPNTQEMSLQYLNGVMETYAPVTAWVAQNLANIINAGQDPVPILSRLTKTGSNV